MSFRFFQKLKKSDILQISESHSEIIQKSIGEWFLFFQRNLFSWRIPFFNYGCQPSLWSLGCWNVTTNPAVLGNIFWNVSKRFPGTNNTGKSFRSKRDFEWVGVGGTTANLGPATVGENPCFSVDSDRFSMIFASFLLVKIWFFVTKRLNSNTQKSRIDIFMKNMIMCPV